MSAYSLSFVAGSQTAAEREKGFKEGISQFSDIDLVATQYSLADATRAMTIMDNVLTANPNRKAYSLQKRKQVPV